MVLRETRIMEIGAMRKPLIVTALALALVFAVTSLADAAATRSDSSGRTAKYFDSGIGAIDEGDYEEAIELLKRVVKKEKKNADAYSMLGFSYRKLGDYDNAFRYYKKALKIDPDHIGANEYIGEAYVETGDIAKAEEHLTVLARLCPGGCEEYDDLAEALAAHKAEHGG